MSNGTVNKVIIIGNLGKDPELRYTGSGKAVAELSIATSESFGRGDEREEKTEWHRVVVWDRTAEACAQYLTKGRKVYVEGRIQTRQWEDQTGATRYTTEIVARDVQFLGGGDGGEGRSSGATRAPREQGQRRRAPVTDEGPPAFEDSDIPF